MDKSPAKDLLTSLETADFQSMALDLIRRIGRGPTTLGMLSIAGFGAYVATENHTNFQFTDGAERLSLSHSDLDKAGLLRSAGPSSYRVFFTSKNPNTVQASAKAELGPGWEQKIDGDFISSEGEVILSAIDPALAQRLHRSPDGTIIVIRTPKQAVRDLVDQGLTAVRL